MSPADSMLIIGKQILKIRLAAHRGRVIVDLRYHYRPATGGNLMPTRRGVTLDAAALQDVIEALGKLKAQMIRDGALEYTGGGSPPKFYPHIYPTDF